MTIFLQDYKIEINLAPYIDEHLLDGDCNISLVLSEPKSGQPIIYNGLSHSDYERRINQIPLHLKKSLNWNFELLPDIFADSYICFAMNQLLDNPYIWSFSDIINIDTIWTNVKVVHQQRVQVWR